MSSECRASVSTFEDFQIVITAFTITHSGRQHDARRRVYGADLTCGKRVQQDVSEGFGVANAIETSNFDQLASEDGF